MEKVKLILQDGKLICPKCNMVYVKNISECYSCGAQFYSSPKLTEKKEGSINKQDGSLIEYGDCYFCGNLFTWYDLEQSVGSHSSDNKQICQKCTEKFIKLHSKHDLHKKSIDDIIIGDYTSVELKNILDDNFVCPNCNLKIDDINNRYCDQCGYEMNPPEKIIVMKCEKCGEEYPETKKYCSQDGTKLVKTESIIDKSIETAQVHKKTEPLNESNPISKSTNSIDSSHAGFFYKLRAGDYGLFKTYWVYGTLIGMISSGLISLMENIEIFTTFTLVHYIYQFIVLMGVWNAANKYNGYKLWAILAKISIILGLVVMIVSFIYIVSLL